MQNNKELKTTKVQVVASESLWSTMRIIYMAIALFIGIYAAYLSWSCNSKLKYNIIAKAIFAFFAWLTGGMYLLMYGILKYDTCAAIPA